MLKILGKVKEKKERKRERWERDRNLSNRGNHRRIKDLKLL